MDRDNRHRIKIKNNRNNTVGNKDRDRGQNVGGMTVFLLVRFVLRMGH